MKDCKVPAPTNMMIRAIEAPPVAEPQPQARTFNMTMKEAVKDADVVAGSLLVNSMHAKVLIDSWATKSFISKVFASKLNCPVELLEKALNVEIANQERIVVDQRCAQCEIEIGGCRFYVDLLPFKSGEFDVILGMDWLSEHEAYIDCKNKKVILKVPD